jgi:hypothetical protein
MQYKYYYLHGLLMIGLVTIFVFLVVKEPATTPVVKNILPIATSTPVISTPVDSGAKNPTRPTTHQTPATTVVSVPIPHPLSHTTLLIGTSSYTLASTTSGTLIDAMCVTNGISVTGRDYPGMGFFLTGINGIVSAHGYNWMVYVDGRQADTGASNIEVNDYKVIEWRYEK